MRQSACQKFVYKIHSRRLRDERWNLSLPLAEARRNEEVISLADSQMLRWIDELNGVGDSDAAAREIKSEIKRIRKEPNSQLNRIEMKRLYARLDELQFIPDYMELIVDRDSDYRRACNGFSINGNRYARLLGTPGGIKNSTIVFVSERLVAELRRRIDNGRNLSKKMVPAKLEAYRALTCSASVPVSFPHGVLVVNDAETEFYDDIIYLSESDSSDEPKMEYRKHELMKIDASDGYGLMLPSLAERWSEELELGYTMSACNTRLAYEKGVVVAFDFLEFANDVAHATLAKDAWGNEVDIRQVEMVLTTSMLKLWDSYDSWDSYYENCMTNRYTFAVTKVAPKDLENERATNYQYLMSFDLSDDDIEELIRPTMQTIKDVLGGDWRKTLLFLQGRGMDENNVLKGTLGIAQAIMADRRVLDDPFVKKSILSAISGRIDKAKIGILDVHGNYSIACGDPYLLCQSIFGLPLTGLLHDGQIYNEYWRETEKVLCFRSPMSCHNNIRKLELLDNDDVRHWYQYIHTCTVFNAWDACMSALNGMDYDGDIVFLTDNDVLLRNHKKLPPLVCEQKTAVKKVPTEEDIIQSNIVGFGNSVGQITNRVTSMYDLLSFYEADSPEHEELMYRIQSGQNFQQNSIDACKGIVFKPMPKSWYDYRSACQIDDDELREFNKRIVADKKPYFMKYIYPKLNKDYNTYIKSTNKKAVREFGVTMQELLSVSPDELTEDHARFIHYYRAKMPVSAGSCTMNKICRRFEDEFGSSVRPHSAVAGKFDYHFMMSGNNYSTSRFYSVMHMLEDYHSKIESYKVFSRTEKQSKWDADEYMLQMANDFIGEALCVCSGEEELCDVVIDICYRKESTKYFVWKMFSDVIVRRLINANFRLITFPVRDESGEIYYGGEYFTQMTICAEDDNGYSDE